MLMIPDGIGVNDCQSFYFAQSLSQFLSVQASLRYLAIREYRYSGYH